MNSWSYPRHWDAQPVRMPVLTQPGTGTRLTVNALGHATGATPGGATFNHPFRPALSAGRITFQLGTVTSLAGDGPMEPKIKVNGQLVPMSGKDGITPAALALSAEVANSDGISWAAMEVHPDDKGELTKDAKVEIVHTATVVSHELDLGRCAIAMILWNGRTPLRVLPIVHFNLRYVRLLPAPGGGAPRHLFL
ncbi:MAG TPA: hypothetical protein VK961_01670 [Chthoniobacter sp.]|nr:hypothetical protein [Chthoniobacter sp.]